MSTKSLRLSPDDEAVLARIQRRTGMTATDALKRGLRALEKDLENKPARTPWEIYQGLGVGEDDDEAAGPSTEVSKTVHALIARKHAQR